MTISRHQAMRLRSAVRDPASRGIPRSRRFAAIVAFFAAASSVAWLVGLSLGAGAFPRAKENQMKLGAMATVVAAVSTMAVGGRAEAQAVQWKVSDGGNGHWYQCRVVQGGIDWELARDHAAAAGGQLACLETSSEEAYCLNAFSRTATPQGWTTQGGELIFGPWIGGYQVSSGAEPSGGWYWLSGAPLDPERSPACCNDSCQGAADEDRLHLYYSAVSASTSWNDLPSHVTCGNQIVAYIAEWSADCNNDGIVDYGQCRDGSLPDYNGNKIPDCCEEGLPCVVGIYPVQWRVEDGGNGHWYRLANLTAPSAWVQARQQALMMGADLVSIPSAEVQAFVVPLLGAAIVPNGAGGVWIGAYQLSGDPEPGGFRWVSGDVFGYTGPGWSPSNCCSSCPGEVGENYVTISSPADSATYGSGIGQWNDVGCVGAQSALLEWSADCNNDGVVDYGQILQGQLADLDANGVPDICEALHVPQDYPTIQTAIDAVPATTHKLVLVAAGTYNESFSLNGKDVLVRGASNGATILDGTGLATSIARFTGSEPATAGVESLVFRNGTAGSRVFPKATFTVGGAIYGLNSSAFIRNCRFEQNEADFGGAVYLLHCDASVEGCVFAGNEALADGGGFLAYECAGAVRGSDFIANNCGASGSGNGGAFKTVGARMAGGVFLLEGCTVSGTSSGVDGAAVHHFENLVLGIAGGLRIEDTEISGNTSVVGAGGVRHDGRQPALVLAGSTAVCTNLVRNVEGAYLLEGAASVCDCLADVTGDGSVNGADLGIALNAWGVADALGTGDVNHDGLVNGVDLGIMLSAWGACH